MRVAARAPGKLAVLGEYAVLGGAPALVLAVDRYCFAEIAPSEDGECRLETRAPSRREMLVRSRGETSPARSPRETPSVGSPPETASAGSPPETPSVGPPPETPGVRSPQQTPAGGFALSGVPLVDRVLAEWPAPEGTPAWRAKLDSSAFHLAGTKLGLGSSAAALVAFAGAWTAWLGLSPPSLARLVELHRRFQGGAGSGFDIAASVTGGAIEFRLDPDSLPVVGVVRMPNSVGFASIFAGRSASTPDFVARFEAWKRSRPKEAEERQLVMTSIAEQGCAAVREGDGPALLRAVEGYGGQLEQLGRDIGADIVTAEHRAIGEIARRFGVAYKVSGAGGGDLGVGLGDDPDALAAFGRAISKNGYEALNLHQTGDGLAVEELAE